MDADPTADPAPGRPPRRTIVMGAAWSPAVIAAAVAAAEAEQVEPSPPDEAPPASPSS